MLNHTTSPAATTKHTHPVVFGRRVSDCPRCQELNAGAPVVRWASAYRTGPTSTEIAAHFASHKHTSGGCGVVCTFGDY